MRLQGSASGIVSNPEFDRFYTEFMKWAAELSPLSTDKIKGYLKQYVNSAGEPVYRTSQKQMNVLTQVMARMKEQGEEQGEAYKDIKVAFVSVSASNMFVQEFMQEVFKPSDDEDDRESSSW
ncbi:MULTISPECIES: hypothetical protein [Pseudomonas]|uniref:hypothetical protein n=1 Tax=Pseudomonas TaxID=286 RepID=UPI001F33233C|nr:MULTISPECIES: hypothetical protein [Pseudomonas]